jgi:hypothetical protein
MDDRAYDPFAPLPSDEMMAEMHQFTSTSDDKVIVTPVPDHAEDPVRAAAGLYGRAPDLPSLYKDANGRLLHMVTRWNKPDGKDIRPLAWVRHPDGRGGRVRR